MSVESNRISFKGASIIDLIITLRTLAESEGGIVQSIIEGVMVDQSQDNIPIILKAKHKKLAYYKVIDFIVHEFEFNNYDIDEFKQRTFRGNKLLNLVQYLDLEILYCKKAKREFKETGIESLRLISKKTIGIQQKVYKRIRDLVQEIFFEQRRSRKGFLSLWITENMETDDIDAEEDVEA